MATLRLKTKSSKQPLRVKLLNALGEVVEGLIPSGHRPRPRQNPALAIARELGNHKHLKPTPIS